MLEKERGVDEISNLTTWADRKGGMFVLSIEEEFRFRCGDESERMSSVVFV